MIIPGTWTPTTFDEVKHPWLRSEDRVWWGKSTCTNCLRRQFIFFLHRDGGGSQLTAAIREGWVWHRGGRIVGCPDCWAPYEKARSWWERRAFRRRARIRRAEAEAHRQAAEVWRELAGVRG